MPKNELIFLTQEGHVKNQGINTGIQSIGVVGANGGKILSYKTTVLGSSTVRLYVNDPASPGDEQGHLHII